MTCIPRILFRIMMHFLQDQFTVNCRVTKNCWIPNDSHSTNFVPNREAFPLQKCRLNVAFWIWNPSQQKVLQVAYFQLFILGKEHDSTPLMEDNYTVHRICDNQVAYPHLNPGKLLLVNHFVPLKCSKKAYPTIHRSRPSGVPHSLFVPCSIMFRIVGNLDSVNLHYVKTIS